MNHKPPSAPVRAASPPESGRAADSASSKAHNGVVIVTGMSGAGKTITLKAFEDMGFEAVDNLPLSLLPAVVREGGDRPLAVGIDIRTRDFGAQSILAEMDRLMEDQQLDIRLLFLDCDDEILRRRFTETRRRHPLATDRPLIDGILHERQLLGALRTRADVVIDTSAKPPGELKQILEGHFGLERGRGLVVFVTSFSYRRGLPREADLVFDARFLRNPHYESDLRPMTGRDAPVAEFVAADPDYEKFFASVTGLIGPLLPRFAAEGKSYLTIAVGCTGGRHRSVMLAEQLAAWLRGREHRVELRHRELEEGGTI